LSISIKKLGVLAVMAALLVMLAALRPTAQTPVAQADLASPGGIAALPSSIPALPGIMNQGMPAIIGTGEVAIVAVWCWGPGGILVDCPDVDGSGSGAITLELTRLYPSGDPAATFAATGTSKWTVGDNSGGDMDAMPGVVAVEVNSAFATTGATQGVNEFLKVTATDETGDVRTTQIVVVDTILAWGPTGQISTASQEQPVFVSYACDKYGRSPLSTIPSFAEAALGDGDGSQGLDDMYDGLYFNGPFPVPLSAGYGSNTLDGDVDYLDVWCGGDTAGSLFDDFVDFQTNKGLFSIDPVAVQTTELSSTADLAGWFYPPILDFDCGEGKTIDTFDIDALLSWAAWFFDDEAEGGCDLDGWRNSVVTTELLGMGEVGVATITAQQGGGISPVRTINVTFTGEAGLSLFITAPEMIGLTGDDFTVAIVDQDGRPVGDETVQCTIDPAGGALAILNQTGTTNSTTGLVTFSLIPTGKSVLGAEELTITCVMDRDRSISATATVTLSTTPELESVALVEGCNPIAATWADGTAIDTVAGAVAPAEALDAIWKFDPATSTWKGFSPSAPPAVSDLASVDRLDAIFICVNAAATIGRPVI